MCTLDSNPYSGFRSSCTALSDAILTGVVAEAVPLRWGRMARYSLPALKTATVPVFSASHCGDLIMMHSRSRYAFLAVSAAIVALAFSGCTHANHPDDRMDVYNALDQNDLRSVTISQDRQAGVITLSGVVGSADRQKRAEQIAQQAAPGYSIVDRIQVDTSGIQSEIQSSTQDAQLDSAIESHFKATLAAHKTLKTQRIKCAAFNGTLTLTGTVTNYKQRQEAEELARKVPQVQHVVNELQIAGKPSPASS